MRPILLIQVEDGSKHKVSATDLSAVVKAIQEEAGSLPPLSFAHAFQEGGPIALDGGVMVRYLSPSSIDADPDVRIVLFKTSLNTGWDCPRAEVMVSFRVAKDATYIAQLVGRMVRSPLQREIEQDEVLNSVSLVLPRFDQEELSKVVDRLKTGADVPPTKVESSRERFILGKVKEFGECFAALHQIPTFIIPRKKRLNEVQRLGLLSDALTDAHLREKASSEAREALVDVLVEEYKANEKKPQYIEVVKPDGTINVQPVVFDYSTLEVQQQEMRQVPVSEEMIAELYEWGRKRLGLDLGLRYWKRRAGQHKEHAHTLSRLELYALAADPLVLEHVRKEASKMTNAWLSEYKTKITKLPESERQPFEEVKQQVANPTLDLMDMDNRETLDWSAPATARRWDRHLYLDSAGKVPEHLNNWEARVLEEEMQRDDFVAWLRNRDRQPWSLCVPYQAGGVWHGCYPDFIIFRKAEDDIIVDVIDPHLISVEDAPKKAAALAKFADEHQDHLGRIDLIIVEKKDGEERAKRLRLLEDHDTRKRVMGVTTNQHLRDLFDLKSV